MSGLQMAIVIGVIVGGGLAGVMYALVPAQPDLADVLERLSPPVRRRLSATAVAAAPAVEERLGIWAERTLPARLLGTPPARDLAVLRMTRAQFYGKKVSSGLIGLVLPSVLTGLAGLLGLQVPFVLPVGATVALAALMFIGPSRDVGQRAADARADAARALGAYIELCALERNRGASAPAALANAAEIGESWIFRRIREELALSRYNGQPPWDALDELAENLGLPELADVADIMRLAGDENTEVYRQLRARSASLRSALLSSELSQANLVEERMYLPGMVLGMVFLALLMAPQLMRMLEL